MFKLFSLFYSYLCMWHLGAPYWSGSVVTNFLNFPLMLMLKWQNSSFWFLCCNPQTHWIANLHNAMALRQHMHVLPHGWFTWFPFMLKKAKNSGQFVPSFILFLTYLWMRAVINMLSKPLIPWACFPHLNRGCFGCFQTLHHKGFTPSSLNSFAQGPNSLLPKW